MQTPYSPTPFSQQQRHPPPPPPYDDPATYAPPSEYFYRHHPLPGNEPHPMAVRSFAQTFGLYPAVAATTVAADVMLHTADIVSGGLLIPFSAFSGVIIGIIAYLAQRKYFNDDDQSALIKALMVGLLTAIPTPLPYMLFVPAGIVGFFRRK